jgi:hypothetical protein
VKPTFKERWIAVKKRGRKKKKKIRIWGINGVYLRRYSKEGEKIWVESTLWSSMMKKMKKNLTGGVDREEKNY